MIASIQETTYIFNIFRIQMRRTTRSFVTFLQAKNKTICPPPQQADILMFK
jgi:hypothetical protein